MSSQYGDYAQEDHQYDREADHIPEPELQYEEEIQQPQPEQQPDPRQQQQQYQSRAPPPERPPPPPPSQPTQYQFSNPAYPPQQPMNYPPQASPQHFTPQAGYYPAQQMKSQQPPNYPPPGSPHAYKPQPSSPYNHVAAPPYQNGGYGAPAPGYMVQQQPYQMSAYAKNPGTNGWSTGLFDCMEDPSNALITACCPCYTFGQVAEIVDKGHTTCATSGILYGCIAAFIGVPCLISCTYRTKLRNQYDLMEVPAADWITHCFCEWCSLCQEYRELKHRGIDPAIGWQGNMMRNQNMQQQPQVAMMPPGNQTMAGP